MSRLAEAIHRVEFDFSKYIDAGGRIAAARAYLQPEEALGAGGLRE